MEGSSVPTSLYAFVFKAVKVNEIPFDSFLEVFNHAQPASTLQLCNLIGTT